MKLFYFLSINLFFASMLQAQLSEHVIGLDYDGKPSFATKQIDSRYLGTYMLDKGNLAHQFMLNMNESGGHLLYRNTNIGQGNGWNTENRQEIEWAFLSTKDGTPLILKMQEYEDGKMSTYSTMVFLYRIVGETVYQSKMLILKNSSLYMDEAPKMNMVVSQ